MDSIARRTSKVRVALPALHAIIENLYVSALASNIFINKAVFHDEKFLFPFFLYPYMLGLSYELLKLV